MKVQSAFLTRRATPLFKSSGLCQRFDTARGGLCLAVLLLAGCLTQRQLIERRIGKKADFFAALPVESQQRLREGKVQSGDSRDAAWIVYGRPDRVFQKITATSTNEVWSYVASGVVSFDEPRPAYQSLRTTDSKTVWRADTLWTTHTRYETYEYLRIEFEGNRVLSVETESPDLPPLSSTP